MLPQIFVALDTPDLTKAKQLATQLKAYPVGLKLGLEFLSAIGKDGVKEMATYGLPLFLDTKFHDIPNTVAAAVRETVKLKPAILNIHASGGFAMMQAAKQARDETAKEMGITPPKLIAVTVLTSMNDSSLSQVGQPPVDAQVMLLSQLSKRAGLDGAVCSPHEAEVVRQLCGDDFLRITPGVRMPEDVTGDQERIATPDYCLNNYSNVLVIGRSITASTNPIEKLEHILTLIESVDAA